MKLRAAAVIIAIAGIAGGAAAVAAPRLWPGAADYRDTVQLAAAVKGAEQAKGVPAVAVSCGRLTGSSYLCVAGTAGGTTGSYQVTVAADGRSWKFG